MNKNFDDLAYLLKCANKNFDIIAVSKTFKFFNYNNLFYPLQFGFRQNYSTTHALISFKETIRKDLEEGKFAYGIFVDLQKAFDMVEHNIL